MTETAEKSLVKVETSSGEEVQNVDKLIEQLKGGEVGAEIKQGEFLSMEPGEEERAFFLGVEDVKKYNGKAGETTPAVKLLMADGKQLFSADKVLISALTGSKAPRPINIVCEGWVDGKAGKYRSFKINEILM